MRRRLAILFLGLVCAVPLASAGCGGDDGGAGTGTVGKQNPGAAETSDDPGKTVTDEEQETETGDDGY